jgi:ParB-like chromosome segregation protein Spo0J
MVKNTPVSSLFADPSNPRKPDQARMALLRLSLQKLGFIQPIFARPDGMLLSGHQRTTASQSLNFSKVPAILVDIPEKDQKGFNIIANRATNDFSAFDTGKGSTAQLHYADVIDAAEQLPDFEGEEWYALRAKRTPLRSIGKDLASKYDKKAIEMAKSLSRLGIEMPVVMSESGQVINGVYRLLAAKEEGKTHWSVITIPDELAVVATHFLNYLSMDYDVDKEFSDILRYSAFRRPQNNRGAVPKAYRFWSNGCRTLPDKDSYTVDYWRHFRDLHGQHGIIDFGAGLGKVAPFLREKGMQCIDFEPYRIDMEKDKGKVCPDLSKREARRFLDEIADGRKFSSIFLASVLNSVPFPKDRMCVLAIVHALSDRDTTIYGTCRDISDFNYEYGGIRNANYFVFDSEPGVRVGDVLRNPKIQKFETPETARAMFSRLWNSFETWPGGNVFYYKAFAPKGANLAVLGQALELEFNLPYSDGTTMDLVDHAKKCFSKRLGKKVP